MTFSNFVNLQIQVNCGYKCQFARILINSDIAPRQFIQIHFNVDNKDSRIAENRMSFPHIHSLNLTSFEQWVEYCVFLMLAWEHDIMFSRKWILSEIVRSLNGNWVKAGRNTDSNCRSSEDKCEKIIRLQATAFARATALHEELS